MGFADLVAIGTDGVEDKQGLVVLVLVDLVVGVGESFEFKAGGVVFEVVADDEREAHGIVRNEFGGGGLEYVELSLRPGKFADKIA